ELPSVAACVHRAAVHEHAVARFRRGGTQRRDRVVPAARAPFRTHQRTSAGGARRVNRAIALSAAVSRPIMLATRIATAVALIGIVLAALFLLPALGWAALSLAAVCAAASEWATLARWPRWAWWLFVAGTLAIGLNLLLSPASGFAGGWPPAVIIA